MKNRIRWIDNAKAIAILMVVIGHIIQSMYSPDNFDENIVFRIIYSFHMPLFIMLSGLVTKPILYKVEGVTSYDNHLIGGVNLLYTIH